MPNACLKFAHLLIFKTIYTDYRLLLNSSLANKKKGKTKHGETLKKKSKLKVDFGFGFSFSRDF